MALYMLCFSFSVSYIVRLCLIKTKLELVWLLQILNNGVVTNQALIDVWDQKDVDARMIIYCNIEP